MTDPMPVDDDDEIELEPIDPAILEHQRQRAKRKVREAEDSADINEVFDQEDIGDPIDFDQLKQFRFTTRHLLIATAVLAMVMTLFIRLTVCMGLFVSGCIALGAGWWFVLREEQRRLKQLAEQRKKYAERHSLRRAIEDGEPLPAAIIATEVKEFEQAGQNAKPDEKIQRSTQHAFRFSFSMKQLLITFTVAAVILGCSQILGFENAALLLGFVALMGVLAQAIGVELPPLVVLGWWLLLVMYILICVIGLWATFAAPKPV